MAREVINSNYIFRLPYALGNILLRKRRTNTKIVDGKIITTRPVDYKATKEFWKENEEAKNNKTLIYHTNLHSGGYVFYVQYAKKTARFKGNRFYKLQMNRNLKRELAQNIKQGKVDALEKHY